MQVYTVIAGVALGLATLTPQAPAPAFDSASVKATTPPADGRFSVGLDFTPAGFHAENVRATDLISAAYNLDAGAKIVGPDWISDRGQLFTVVAKAAGPTPQSQVRLMLQQLLANRFYLQLHPQPRAAKVYGLVLYNKKTITPVTFDGENPMLGSMHMTASGIEFQHASMREIVNILSSDMGTPVSDETGSAGLYTFTLEYANHFGRPLMDASAAGDPEHAPESLPSIFAALEAVGLKLEARQGSIRDYVIDRIAKPTEN